MTKEEFSSLSILEQEAFINSGETLSPCSSEELKREKQPLTAESSLSLYSQSEDLKFPSTKDKTVTSFSRPMNQGVIEHVEQNHTASYAPSNNDPSESNDVYVGNYVDGFDIKDPVELLILLDDNISSGRVTLHDWQIQFMLDFAEAGESDKAPFQAVVRACNGSGKDKFIIAPCALWLNMRYKKARGIVTSSSGVQLNNQTCTYLTMLAEASNRKWGTVWKCNYRFYQCLATESPIICYATDEPGKAEGFHPLDYGAKMGIFVSEDKSVPDDINNALNKCTGYTHRCHVSTPGLPMGHFFDYCSTAVDRKSIKSVKEVKSDDYVHYHVTAYECSHISKAYIEQMKRDLPGGETGSAFKSQVLAEFGTTDEMVVIPYTYIWKAYTRQDIVHIHEPYNNGGLDLSDGGDETVLTVVNGNRHLATIPFRFDNTQDTIDFLIEKFKEHHLTHPEAFIYADAGGLGKPIIDDLRRRGWRNIRYVDNRNTPQEPRTYLNRGAELWFHLRKLFERGEIILVRDDRLIRQLSTRYYKITSRNVHQLLSKIESRSRGYPSPDRADSLVLAFSGYKSTKPASVVDAPLSKYEEKEVETSPGTYVLKSAMTTKKTNGKFSSSKISHLYNVNNRQKDFKELQSEIEQYNQKLLAERT